MKKLAALCLAAVLCLGLALGEEFFSPAPIREEAVMADFLGEWLATQVDFSGTVLSTEALGMTIRLLIDRGYVTVEEGNGGMVTECIADMEGHALVLTSPEQEANILHYLYLHTDGLLSMTRPGGETVYFERILHH